MSLRRQLTVTMAIVLAVGLAVANIVIYSSFRSSLYGRVDEQLDGGQVQAYRYLTYAYTRDLAVTRVRLENHVSPDLYVMVLSRSGKTLVSAPSGPAFAYDPPLHEAVLFGGYDPYAVAGLGDT